MKKTFLSGLAIFLPAMITIFIILFTINCITAPFTNIVQELIAKYGTQEFVHRHDSLIFVMSRIVVLIFVFSLILTLGAFGRKILLSWFIHFTQYIFCKIPIIKTIYKITQEICTTIFDKNRKKLFQSCVLVPFPYEKTRVFALLSDPVPEAIAEKKKCLQAVFVPTAPHPISGFLLLYNQEEVQHTDIKTEDLLTFLLSCGMYHKNMKNEP